MNIILFRSAEVELPLPLSDVRARHIVSVLRREVGDAFDAGIINGPRGKGSVLAIEQDQLRLAFTWHQPPPPADPLTLLIGLPRPQTARDILRDATTLGVAAIHFVRTDKGESSYSQSSLWRAGEWEDYLIAGAAQAFCTRIPEVTHGRDLAAVIAGLGNRPLRLALDNYEASIALADIAPSAGGAVALALGPERGWSERERTRLRENKFILAHLGSRVLRAETACIAAIAIIKAKCGWF